MTIILTHCHTHYNKNHEWIQVKNYDNLIWIVTIYRQNDDHDQNSKVSVVRVLFFILCLIWFSNNTNIFCKT